MLSTALLQLTFLGVFVSLLALIPPVRSFARTDFFPRLTTTFFVGILALVISFFQWNWLLAESGVSLLYAFDLQVLIDTPERVESAEEEMWRRLVMPPNWGEICYTDLQATCDDVDIITYSNDPLDTDFYFRRWIFSLWGLMVALQFTLWFVREPDAGDRELPPLWPLLAALVVVLALLYLTNDQVDTRDLLLLFSGVCALLAYFADRKLMPKTIGAIDRILRSTMSIAKFLIIGIWVYLSLVLILFILDIIQRSWIDAIFTLPMVVKYGLGILVCLILLSLVKRSVKWFRETSRTVIENWDDTQDRRWTMTAKILVVLTFVFAVLAILVERADFLA